MTFSVAQFPTWEQAASFSFTLINEGDLTVFSIRTNGVWEVYYNGH